MVLFNSGIFSVTFYDTADLLSARCHASHFVSDICHWALKIRIIGSIISPDLPESNQNSCYMLMRPPPCFSVDSAVLQSRAADPEEMLYNLGFGGSDQLAR